MGTLVQLGSNGESQPFNGLVNIPHGIRVGNKAFITWQGASLAINVAEYDYVTKEVSLLSPPLHNPCPDDHGAPVIFKDKNDYIHLLYGGHNTELVHAKSSVALSVSSFSIVGNIISYATYPKVIVLEDGTIYFTVRNPEVTKTSIFKSTDNGDTWDSGTPILNIAENSDANGSYVGRTLYDSVNGRIWMAWCFWDVSSGIRRNIYCAYLKLSDMHMYSPTDVDLGTTITLAEMDSDCKIFDSGTTWTDIPALRLDANGKPCILFPFGDTQNCVWKFIRYLNGSIDVTTFASAGSHFSCSDFIIAGSIIHAFITRSPVSLRGGDIEEWFFDGSSWYKYATILTSAQSGRGVGNVQIINQSETDVDMVFTELIPDDFNTQDLKMYLYNEVLTESPPPNLEGVGLNQMGKGWGFRRWNPTVKRWI
jgi:hypothetical protein